MPGVFTRARIRGMRKAITLTTDSITSHQTNTHTVRTLPAAAASTSEPDSSSSPSSSAPGPPSQSQGANGSGSGSGSGCGSNIYGGMVSRWIQRCVQEHGVRYDSLASKDHPSGAGTGDSRPIPVTADARCMKVTDVRVEFQQNFFERFNSVMRQSLSSFMYKRPGRFTQFYQKGVGWMVAVKQSMGRHGDRDDDVNEDPMPPIPPHMTLSNASKASPNEAVDWICSYLLHQRAAQDDNTHDADTDAAAVDEDDESPPRSVSCEELCGAWSAMHHLPFEIMMRQRLQTFMQSRPDRFCCHDGSVTLTKEYLMECTR